MTGNESIREVSGEKRNWLTGEEFLAIVEAYRLAREKEPLKARKQFRPGPFSRKYLLNPHLSFTPRKRASEGREAA